MFEAAVEQKQLCYHCGELCRDECIEAGGKHFCCPGCKMVYEILEENNLCTYYDLEQTPGKTATPLARDKFAWLDDPGTVDRLLDFREGSICKVTFFIPSIHCSSCIWLLEKLYKLNPGVQQSQVNFLKKQVSITYDSAQVSLRRIVELLASIAYEPQINLGDLEKNIQKDRRRILWFKIGLAGFAFGNSMLLSFPEYLDGAGALTPTMRVWFGYLNIALSIPVLFFSAAEFYQSAWGGLKKRMLNIDVPIALGISVLLVRSIFDIVTGMGAGYLDSFNGLVFFLLIGRLFQEKTYATLSFERNYKSYFPVSVSVERESKTEVIPLSKLQIGDVLVLRNQELIPADSILLSDNSAIDYSFVTGESDPVSKTQNELLYAGGRVTGSSIRVRTVKKVSQSYLTQLWNSDASGEDEAGRLGRLSDAVGRWFTWAILSIAAVAAMYWLPQDWHMAIDVVSAILIVACPCALALAIPFTFGNAMRVLGRNDFYLKNITVIEKLHSITHIVFDKTGTLTWQKEPEIRFTGTLSREEESLVRSLVYHSIHPLSRMLAAHLEQAALHDVRDFSEIPGLGLEGTVRGTRVRVGSAVWCSASHRDEQEDSGSHIQINGQYKGCFVIRNRYREGLNEVLRQLARRFTLALLSGDTDREKGYLRQLFRRAGSDAEILFNQSPHNKQDFILRHQQAGARTLMIGDGLNDAGALKKSNLGISIAEDVNAFSPACDAILKAKSFRFLPRFIRYADYSYIIVWAAFVLSFLYNIVGLSFAVRGDLSPIIAAILMPLSSISVVLFATLGTRAVAWKMGLHSWK